MLDESIRSPHLNMMNGNPNKPDYYEYMLSYSPYDNVGPYKYPAIFVFTGLHDSQVQYWEPASGSQNCVLIRLATALFYFA